MPERHMRVVSLLPRGEPSQRLRLRARSGPRGRNRRAARGLGPLDVAAGPRRFDDALDAGLVRGDAQRHLVLGARAETSR